MILIVVLLALYIGYRAGRAVERWHWYLLIIREAWRAITAVLSTRRRY